MTAPKGFTKLLQHSCVDGGSYEPQERSHGGSVYWLYLKRGWYCADSGTHTISGETLAELQQQLSCLVECNCDTCKGEVINNA